MFFQSRNSVKRLHLLQKKSLRIMFFQGRNSVKRLHLLQKKSVRIMFFQGRNSVKRLHLLQKKSLRIMFFQSRNSHAGPLFKVSKILKSFDKIALENCIFISKSLKGLLLSIFNNWFKFSFESHS